MEVLPIMGTLMTVVDLANYLNLSKSTVYLWVKKGLIPAIKIEGTKTLRFDKDDINRTLKNQPTSKTNSNPIT